MLRRIKRALGLTMNRKLASVRGEAAYQTGSDEVEFRGNSGTTRMTIDTFERIHRLGSCLDRSDSFTVDDPRGGELLVEGKKERTDFAYSISADGPYADSRNRVNVTPEAAEKVLDRFEEDGGVDTFEPTEVANYKSDHLWQTGEESFEFRGNKGKNALTLENLETINRLAPCAERGDEFTVSNDHATTLVEVRTTEATRYDYKVSLYTKRSGSPTSSRYDAKVHTVADSIRDGIEAAGASVFEVREVSSTIGEHAYLVDETTVEFRGNRGDNRMTVGTVERLSRLGPCMDVGDTMVLSDDEGDHHIERVERGSGEMYEIGLNAPYGEVDPDDGKVRIEDGSVSNILDAAE